MSISQSVNLTQTEFVLTTQCASFIFLTQHFICNPFIYLFIYFRDKKERQWFVYISWCSRYGARYIHSDAASPSIYLTLQLFSINFKFLFASHPQRKEIKAPSIISTLLPTYENQNWKLKTKSTVHKSNIYAKEIGPLPLKIDHVRKVKIIGRVEWIWLLYIKIMIRYKTKSYTSFCYI